MSLSPKLGCLCLALVAACSSDSGDGGKRFTIEEAEGLGGTQAETLCSSWCNVETGCSQFGSEESCRKGCRLALARNCGKPVAQHYGCLLDLGCDDELDECAKYDKEVDNCHGQLLALCGSCRRRTSCGPDTATGQVCEQDSLPQHEGDGSCLLQFDVPYPCEDRKGACNLSGGNCDADQPTEYRRFLQRAGLPD